MSYESLRADFRDVNVVTATPFTDDGESVRYDAVEENASELYDAGLRLFIACGGVSEYYSLSTEERVGVVEATVDAVGDDATVVGGVGGSRKNAVDLAARYDEAGADAVMAMFPQRPNLHRDGLSDYYRTVVAETDLGVMLYKSDARLDTDLLDDLAGFENVVAVKHAVDSVSSFVADRNGVDADLAWIDGNAEVPAVASGLEGADGFTSGIANFVPELSLALADAIREADWERARRLRELVRPFQELRVAVPGSTGVGVVKHGMDLAGYDGGPVRAPLAPMAEEHRARTAEIYDRVSRELDRVTA